MLDEQRPNIAILKIDVERHEDHVIKGGLRLLRSGLVQNVFMELATHKPQSVHNELISTMLNASYRLYKWGSFRGPSRKSNETRAMKQASIMRLINETKNHEAINVWWKLRM